VKSKRPGRHRFAGVTRHGPGHVTADVLNTKTGQTRRFRFTRTDDGGLDVEELQMLLVDALNFIIDDGIEAA